MQNLEDLSNVNGIVLYIKSFDNYQKIKESLTKPASQVSDQHLCVINKEICKGSGEMVAAFMNQPQVTDKKEFIKTLKLAFNFLGEYEFHQDKTMLVVTDDITDDIKFEIDCLKRMNKNRHLDVSIVEVII
jgi:hypothetical protein